MHRENVLSGKKTLVYISRFGYLSEFKGKEEEIRNTTNIRT